MAMNNVKFIDTISTIVYNLIGKRIEAIGVPEDQWIQIRESFVKNQHNDLSRRVLNLVNLRKILLFQRPKSYLVKN